MRSFVLAALCCLLHSNSSSASDTHCSCSGSQNENNALKAQVARLQRANDEYKVLGKRYNHALKTVDGASPSHSPGFDMQSLLAPRGPGVDKALKVAGQQLTATKNAADSERSTDTRMVFLHGFQVTTQSSCHYCH